jgi:IS1 family transposase
MNRLDATRRAQVIASLVEGNSIRATSRMTGVAKNTIIKLLLELGAACSDSCSDYQDRAFRGLACRRIQCDEIWAFVGSKDKNVPASKVGQYGSVWTWVAIDADSKLLPSWRIGPRDGGVATEFIQDLAGRLRHRVQLTTDGHRPYLDAVEDSFGCDIDYAMLVKLYGNDPTEQKRYSPAQCIGTRIVPIIGQPEPEYISTSYIERQNLTMRMNMRRFTRLTNGFSKKIENHAAAVAIHFMHYNFVRIHQTLRVTPAMAAGVTGRLWSVYDLVALLERRRALPVAS